MKNKWKSSLAVIKAHTMMNLDQLEATTCLGATKWLSMVVKVLAVVPELGITIK